MSSLAELNALNRANDTLKASARRELRTIMARLDPSGPDEVRDVLLRVMPELTIRYGQASGAVAAEWLEAIIGLRDVVIPDTIELPAVAASARWAVGDLYAGGTLGVTMSRAEGSLLRHGLQMGRSTVAESATRSRVGYARILQGDKNCAFCVMAAGRGATYSSARAAGGVVGRGLNVEDAKNSRAARAAKGQKSRGARAIGDKFHDHCDCAVVPVRDEKDWPAGYDIGRLERMYTDAVDEAGAGRVLKGGTPGPNKGGADDEELSVLQVMRRNYGLK